MKLRAGGLHHFAIKSADPERLAAFYRDVLGLEEVARHPMPDTPERVRSVWLACGPTLLMIERAGRDAPEPAGTFEDDPPGLHLVAFEVAADDAGAWRARLEAAGHPVVHATAFTLYCLDPDGNRVGLSSYDSSSVLARTPPARRDS